MKYTFVRVSYSNNRMWSIVLRYRSNVLPFLSLAIKGPVVIRLSHKILVLGRTVRCIQRNIRHFPFQMLIKGDKRNDFSLFSATLKSKNLSQKSVNIDITYNLVFEGWQLCDLEQSRVHM